jgi:hypothetical protein
MRCVLFCRPSSPLTPLCTPIPIVWIGAAIAGAAVLIYKYWEPLKAFFSGLFSGISQGFAAFAPFGTVFTAIADAVKGVWE